MAVFSPAVCVSILINVCHCCVTPAGKDGGAVLDSAVNKATEVGTKSWQKVRRLGDNPQCSSGAACLSSACAGCAVDVLEPPICTCLRLHDSLGFCVPLCCCIPGLQVEHVCHAVPVPHICFSHPIDVPHFCRHFRILYCCACSGGRTLQRSSRRCRMRWPSRKQEGNDDGQERTTYVHLAGSPHCGMQ